MEDKNKDHRMIDADPNDLRQHFQFAHAIVVAMGTIVLLLSGVLGKMCSRMRRMR
ncbi:hypothetical protein C1H46_032539 [Malus baccata]|uniref:Uncharacterized protein n=1 Tax=Malus baccata TaxID=106549 RepID=A0A540L5Y0_MALBA|nr:hypothetical protein C1H46_032539 [Malus baccata]